MVRLCALQKRLVNNCDFILFAKACVYVTHMKLHLTCYFYGQLKCSSTVSVSKVCECTDGLDSRSGRISGVCCGGSSLSDQ
jgi:hypothetical protein